MSEPSGDAPKPKDTRTDHELSRDIERGRTELASTLDALEYKFDVPARGAEFLGDARRVVARTWDENPLLVIGAAVGAVVAIVGAVVGAIALARRDDDPFDF